MEDEESEAMAAVIADMGNAARAAKVKKYSPKPPPVAVAVEAEEPSGENQAPSMEELAAMLGC